MTDLPLTPKTLAEGCLAAARKEGLDVRIRNRHLLQYRFLKGKGRAIAEPCLFLWLPLALLRRYKFLH